jgi:hypothetical protein
MASIKLGSIASDIRGSIGGTVFSRNGGGAYAKQRVKGTNPNTGGQQLMRSIISSMIVAWAALSAGVKTGWSNYAQSVTLINRLGDAINVSGYNMYCRTRSLVMRLGLTMPATAPTILTLAEQDPTIAVTPSAGGSTLSIAFDHLLGWAGELGGHLVVYQGRPQNATVNSYDGPFNIMGMVDGALVPPTSPASMPSLYTMAVGQHCFCQFRILRADGRLSTPFRKMGVVGS